MNSGAKPVTAASTPIWTGTLDEVYVCEVVRTGDYTGELRILLGGEMVHSEDVTLEYGAPFGPDAADVRQWQNRCVEVVDSIDNPEAA